ncbi:hypothetical protein QTI51_38015, partial [Variovorax sp. J22G73]|nr:hypothetical protein [Variovorax sp. J22R203]MDM0103119.1 hypothetical protein [Variovorax sp. J22G73]
SNPIFVGIHELPPGSPSFRPHPLTAFRGSIFGGNQQADTMAMTGHTDVATVLGYYHSQAGTQSHVANLLGTDAGDRIR